MWCGLLLGALFFCALLVPLLSLLRGALRAHLLVAVSHPGMGRSGGQKYPNGRQQSLIAQRSEAVRRTRRQAAATDATGEREGDGKGGRGATFGPTGGDRTPGGSERALTPATLYCHPNRAHRSAQCRHAPLGEGRPRRRRPSPCCSPFPGQANLRAGRRNAGAGATGGSWARPVCGVGRGQRAGQRGGEPGGARATNGRAGGRSGHWGHHGCPRDGILEDCQ